MGLSASPAGLSCVDSARRAAEEATSAWPALPGVLRSMFGLLPTPATPPRPRLSAIRAGCAAGSPAPCAAMACAGLSTDVGDVACAAEATARDGERPGVPVGSMVGVAEFWARAAPASETCAVALATFAAAVGCVRVAPAVFAVG